MPENGVAQETRVVADDLAAASATSGASAAPRVRVPTFDRLHAERIALGTAGALSVGYIIAVKHSLNMTNLYIGSLFQGIEEENKRRPAHQGQ